MYALCMGFSWAIGLSTFQPNADHARGLALGTIIWGAIAMWIALFFGALSSAIVGRSPDSRGGVMHGLVVWGSSAALLGFVIMIFFSNLLGGITQMSETGGAPAMGANAMSGVVRAAGLTVWLYWAGILGGLFTSILGGFVGARSERKAPKRVVTRAPAGAGVAQPAY